MTTWRLGRRHTLFASAGAVFGLVVALAVTPVVVNNQAAEASVSAGDLVFERIQAGPPNYPAQIQQRASGGALTNLSFASGAYPVEDHSPAVSPDGSRIAFIGARPDTDNVNYESLVLMVMNSDGSGQAAFVAPTTTGESDSAPVWSPDGTKIAFSQQIGSSHYIAVINADGLTETPLTTGGVEFNPSWSPTKISGHYRITYESDSGSGSNGQLYIMNDDGTSKHTVASTDTGYNDLAPTWSVDGNRIYFTSGQGLGIYYYSSANGFASGSVTRANLSTSGPSGTGEDAEVYVRSSASGTTLAYSAPDTSGCNQLWTISSSGGSPTKVTDTGCTYLNYAPTFVTAAWPPSPPSNATVTLSAPSPSDAPYTRKITIGLSATGVSKFQYGWSNSSSTAPNTIYLQESTDLTTKKGTLNYLGKYSGSGTTWNGGTMPDADWYLWVRSVKTGGTANAWGTPLKVHTPRKPVWVSVGDSYSSGHHQDADEPLCPDPNDVYIWLVTNACNISGAPHMNANDEASSWVYPAVVSYDSGLHLPSAWSWAYFSSDVEKIAISGQATATFGATGQTAGTTAWATGDTQMAKLRAALYSRPDSWNVVSMTGGADDTSWVTTLKDWYNNSAHWSSLDKPWMMDTSTSNCPDSNAVYIGLQSGTPTLHSKIQTNLQGVATYAVSLSPGVRVLNVGYPYVLDATDNTDSKSYCNSDHGSWKGFKSVIDSLNTAHTSVTGSNVKYVDLTASTAFGTNPVHNGYIETFRYYGYPHPTITAAGGIGEGKEAAAAVSVLTGSGW